MTCGALGSAWAPERGWESPGDIRTGGTSPSLVAASVLTGQGSPPGALQPYYSGQFPGGRHHVVLVWPLPRAPAEVSGGEGGSPGQCPTRSPLALIGGALLMMSSSEGHLADGPMRARMGLLPMCVCWSWAAIPRHPEHLPRPVSQCRAHPHCPAPTRRL